MDEETQRAVADLRAQVRLLSKQIGQLAGAEDRLKEAVAGLLTDVREDTYRSVMSVFGELKKVDDARAKGQRQAQIVRYAILSGVVAALGILSYLLYLGVTR